MEILDKYINQLLDKSTPQAPIWNIEKIQEGAESSWNYIDGCMIKAILELYYITKSKKYLDFAENFISYFIEEDGNILTYDPEELNIDNINEGKVLFDLYDITGKEKYRLAIEKVYSQIKMQPRTKCGNFWHKNIYPYQIWLDGLYMAQPFYMEYEVKYNNKLNCIDIFNQFKNVNKLMRDSKTGLYYHGYDESRNMFWADKETGLSKNFWLRALGWFTVSLVDTIEKVDEEFNSECEELISILQNLISSLVKFQHESGLWYQVVDKQFVSGNYLETSGSSLISYAILKACRLSYISQEYRVYGEKAFKGICNMYLTEENGNLKLGGICLVAGLGGKTMRDGSIEYYLSEPIVENEAKGVAPLLLAYTEILKSKTIL